ncbi:MAG: hypothetical protein F6K39_36080 [Okeania sp. SIO3B3]|nr:hypothetical protein [Okeania sp. SIO3B3]
MTKSMLKNIKAGIIAIVLSLLLIPLTPNPAYANDMDGVEVNVNVTVTPNPDKVEVMPEAKSIQVESELPENQTYLYITESPEKARDKVSELEDTYEIVVPWATYDEYPISSGKTKSFILKYEDEEEIEVNAEELGQEYFYVVVAGMGSPCNETAPAESYDGEFKSTRTLVYPFSDPQEQMEKVTELETLEYIVFTPQEYSETNPTLDSCLIVSGFTRGIYLAPELKKRLRTVNKGGDPIIENVFVVLGQN